jgi:hypothetical protein
MLIVQKLVLSDLLQLLRGGHVPALFFWLTEPQIHGVCQEMKYR